MERKACLHIKNKKMLLTLPSACPDRPTPLKHLTEIMGVSNNISKPLPSTIDDNARQYFGLDYPACKHIVVRAPSKTDFLNYQGCVGLYPGMHALDKMSFAQRDTCERNMFMSKQEISEGDDESLKEIGVDEDLIVLKTFDEYKAYCYFIRPRVDEPIKDDVRKHIKRTRSDTESKEGWSRNFGDSCFSGSSLQLISKGMGITDMTSCKSTQFHAFLANPNRETFDAFKNTLNFERGANQEDASEYLLKILDLCPTWRQQVEFNVVPRRPDAPYMETILRINHKNKEKDLDRAGKLINHALRDLSDNPIQLNNFVIVQVQLHDEGTQRKIEYGVCPSILITVPNGMSGQKYYVLKGFIAHIGKEVDEGHYVYINLHMSSNPPYAVWTKYDDGRVENNVDITSMFKTKNFTASTFLYQEKSNVLREEIEISVNVENALWNAVWNDLMQT